MHSTLVLLSTAIALAAGANEAPKPWSASSHPTGVPRSHVEEIAAGLHKYTVVQGGTMDGRNCRLPMGCGIAREGALLRTWESNRSVRMENVGQSDVVNPWLSNGRNNFRNVEEIVSAAVAPGMTDAEKAFALWFHEIRYRHHSPGDNNELGDPVKVFNVYGYNTCGNDSIALATLWRNAELKAAPARALGHCISQAFYDDRWHFYDGDLPGANKAHYRVVAVDAQGKRSGPSDYAASPRPVIYSKPVPAAKVGAEYRYQVCAIRSVGDLSARMKGEDQVSGYFDVEKPTFALEEGPAWLKIDPSTGVLSGTPNAPGKAAVTVRATINRAVRLLDEKALVWGREKVLSTAAERVGTASQKFVIEVR